MSAGIRCMRVAWTPPKTAKPAQGVGMRGRLALLLLAAALFLALPGVVLAARSWAIGLTPSTIPEDTDTAVQVTATNTGGGSGSEQVGCVEILIPVSFEVNGLVINGASGRNWIGSYTKGAVDTVVRLQAVNGGERLDGDPALQSVTATLTVYGDLVGNYLWVADAFNNENCSDSFLQPQVLLLSVGPAAPNTAPIAADDAYATTEDAPLAAPAPGVLVNDTDAEADPLIAVLVSGPAHAASFGLATDGSFSYQPVADWWGTDSFSYQASDGSATSGVATVFISVGAASDAPVAAEDTYPTNEDMLLTVTAPGVLANDADADGEALTAILVSAPPTAAAFSLAADGSFSYQPAADFNGTETFSYEVTDGVLTSGVATTTFNVAPVNDAPVAAEDAYTIAEDGELMVVAPGVLANDVDVDGDPLAAIPASGPAHGSLALGPGGSLTYHPPPDFYGTDAFGYQASDSVAASQPTVVTISVAPVNDAPVAADDIAFSSGAAVKISVLANDEDVDGPELEVAGFTQPTHGSVSRVGSRLRYEPDPGFAGVDSFHYLVTDGPASDAATVTITVDLPEPSSPPEPASDLMPALEPPALPPAPADPQAPAGARPPARPSGAGPLVAPDPAPPAPNLAVAPLVLPPTQDEADAPLMTDLAFARLAIDWFIPSLAFGVPSVLVALAVAAQLFGAAVWLPAVRGALGSFGVRRRRRSAMA